MTRAGGKSRSNGPTETCKHPDLRAAVSKGMEDIPADTLLADELAGEDVLEMANLTTAQTGGDGTIFISTAMGAHGPPVKYFRQPGRSQPSFSVTISDAPTVVANSLPDRVVRQMSPQVIAWVSRNRDALLDFWRHGDTWTQPEVNDFIQKLQRV
ncbi:MAG TPA: hypothetical protein VM755_18360 [Stellaceae bacterium]|nr:hypothetical protein [Stellaceae bacterium]